MPADAMNCTALVLAAGRGTRFGSDKRLARLPSGQTLLAATLARALEHFTSVSVVLRPGEDTQQLGIDARARVIRAEQAGQGMGASLAAGIAALQATPAQAVAVLLGDMPWIALGTLQQLTAQAGSDRIVVPMHQGQRGHPVIFGCDFWPELGQVQGDQGGRQVILDHPQACFRIEVEDLGVVQDIDTPDQLTQSL